MKPGIFAGFSQICAIVVLLCIIHFTVTFIYYFGESASFWSKRLSRVRGAVPVITVTMNMSESHAHKNHELQTCLQTARLEGLMNVESRKNVTLEMVRKENPELKEGGRWKPSNCTAPQKVALIIPFRDRNEHLKIWLYYLHPFLQRQQLDYGIYVINQDGKAKFNRAKLLNVGFAEALKEYDYECFVFSDVDIIPMDDRNIYKCYSQPRHIAAALDKFGFRLLYKRAFGGVSALSKEQYMRINGLPNNYWGWGGEDDDISNRLNIKGMSISRPNMKIGKCRMIRHRRDARNEANPKRFYNIRHTRQTMGKDGFNSLKYNVVIMEKDLLFTKITVDIGRP